MATGLAADPTERLENGTGRSTPDGDNLILDHLRAEAAAYTSITTVFGGRTHEEPELRLRCTDMGVPTPFGATSFLDGPIATARTSDLVDALHAFYRGGTGGPFLLYSPWPIADLSGHGFSRIGYPPLMFRPIGGTAPIATGLRIVEARNEATLADFERTLIEAYPVPEMQPWRQGSFLCPEILDTPWRFFVGYEHDEPVATSAAFVTDQITMVELVAARERVRGRGYGRALTAAATVVEPAKPAMLIASDLGQPVYDRLGYLPLTRYSLWLGTR
jgi:hypothetical protein